MATEPTWYVNEDGEPYPFAGTVEEQTAQFPNDFHTPYSSHGEAYAAAESLPVHTAYDGEFVTLTFVVRTGPGDMEEPEDPRTLLTNDEVMFWGSEPGISKQALDLGADPDMWIDTPRTHPRTVGEWVAEYHRLDAEANRVSDMKEAAGVGEGSYEQADSAGFDLNEQYADLARAAAMIFEGRA